MITDLVSPLGAYRLAAELQGFKKYDQAGISLSAGQVAVVDVKLAVGGAIHRDAVFSPTGGYEQRQLQLGFRVTF